MFCFSLPPAKKWNQWRTQGPKVFLWRIMININDFPPNSRGVLTSVRLKETKQRKTFHRFMHTNCAITNKKTWHRHWMDYVSYKASTKKCNDFQRPFSRIWMRARSEIWGGDVLELRAFSTSKSACPGPLVSPVGFGSLLRSLKNLRISYTNSTE